MGEDEGEVSGYMRPFSDWAERQRDPAVVGRVRAEAGAGGDSR